MSLRLSASARVLQCPQGTENREGASLGPPGERDGECSRGWKGLLRDAGHSGVCAGVCCPLRLLRFGSTWLCSPHHRGVGVATARSWLCGVLQSCGLRVPGPSLLPKCLSLCTGLKLATLFQRSSSNSAANEGLRFRFPLSTFPVAAPPLQVTDFFFLPRSLVRTLLPSPQPPNPESFSLSQQGF